MVSFAEKTEPNELLEMKIKDNTKDASNSDRYFLAGDYTCYICLDELPSIIFLTPCQHEACLTCFMNSVDSNYENGLLYEEGISCFQAGCQKKLKHSSIFRMNFFGIYFPSFIIYPSCNFIYYSLFLSLT